MGVETLAIAAIVGTVASTAVGVVGQMQQAAAAKKAAAYQAQVAQNNAAIAERNRTVALNNQQTSLRNAEIARADAAAAEAAGAQTRTIEALKTRETLGRQKAAAAASGLDVNSGSAVDIRAGTAGMGMVSDMNIRDDVARKAYNLRIKGKDYETEAETFGLQAESFGLGADSAQAQASAARAAGSAAQTAGILGSVGTLAGGVAKTSTMLSDFQRTGGTPLNTTPTPVVVPFGAPRSPVIVE